MNETLALFENFQIRRIYDEKREVWYFSVVDILRVLIQQPDFQAARKYWNKLTDYWKDHEIKKEEEFAILTNIIHQEWSDLTVKDHKKIKGLKTQNLRDHMSEAELIFTDILRLTKPGYRKSYWSLPAEFEGLDITYHGNVEKKRVGDRLEFRSVAKGQEFVIPHNGRLDSRLKSVLSCKVSSRKLTLQPPRCCRGSDLKTHPSRQRRRPGDLKSQSAAHGLKCGLAHTRREAKKRRPYFPHSPVRYGFSASVQRAYPF
jgi:hypothetical protein